MCSWFIIVDIDDVEINGAYRRNIEKHYVGFDMLENIKFTLNDSIKVKMKCWLSLVSYFFAVPSRLRRYFARSLSTGRNRERRENKACSKTDGGLDLVQFKLELTPNHQNSLLKITGIRFTRYFFVPVPN